MRRGDRRLPDDLDLNANRFPVAALIRALGIGIVSPSKLAQFRRSIEKARAAAGEYAERLDTLYDDIERSGHDADWIVQATTIIRQRENTERERLWPGIEAAKKKLAARAGLDDSETRELVEDSIAIAEAWLALPATLHKKLLKLATRRRDASHRILQARPVKGEIDYTELSREHLARYPKIRAALAK
jgi:hypothetical protein